MAEETVEVTEATTAVEVITAPEEVEEIAGTAEVKDVAGAMEVTEPTEATATIEDAKVEVAVEVAGEVEVTAVGETTEPTEATEAAKTVEVTEVSEVTEATEVAELIEAKEVTEAVDTAATEVVETAEVEDVTGTTEIKAKAEVTEMIIASTETVEAEPVDYEALGLRSVELNPNDYPDEVIALLGPHKNDENNNSVLFYSSLGLAYKSKGRFKAAIDTYKHALELVQNVPAPSIQYNLGIAYYYNNELHKSFSCFLNSSAQRPDHLGTEKWIKQLADKLDIYKVPNTNKLKIILNRRISVDREKDDRESRLRVYLTQNGGRIQELSVKDKIYSYGIDSDTKRPVDYIIIDNDGDGSFDNVINTKGKFGVPTWAYNPD